MWLKHLPQKPVTSCKPAAALDISKKSPVLTIVNSWPLLRCRAVGKGFIFTPVRGLRAKAEGVEKGQYPIQKHKAKAPSYQYVSG